MTTRFLFVSGFRGTGKVTDLVGSCTNLIPSISPLLHTYYPPKFQVAPFQESQLQYPTGYVLTLSTQISEGLQE